MGMIQKRGEHLKRGDVVRDFYGSCNAELPAVVVSGWSAGKIMIVDANQTVMEPLIGYASAVGVESPDLTPAQQRAEELAKYATEYLSLIETGARSGACLNERDCKKLRALLEAIKPPEPPTLAEALELLARMPSEFTTVQPAEAQAARDILDRARRCKVLP